MDWKVDESSTQFLPSSQTYFLLPVVVAVQSIPTMAIESEDADFESSEMINESLYHGVPEKEAVPPKPLNYSAFNAIQLEVLIRKYEEQKNVLQNTRFDDPREKIRQAWRDIAKAVNEVGNGHKKYPSTCWKKLLPILLQEKEERDNSYIAESSKGAIQLKHVQIQLPKCDDPIVKENPELLDLCKVRGKDGYYTNLREKIKDRQTRLQQLLRRKQTAHRKIYREHCALSSCHFVARDPDLLLGHYRGTHEGDPRPFKCSFTNCDKSYIRYKGLQAHRNIHRGNYRHICETCGQKFITRYSLTVHILRHHTANPTMFPCSHCPRKYLTLTALTSHMQIHEPKKILCPVDGCIQTFHTLISLQKHQGRKHKDVYPHLAEVEAKLMCEECGETFKEKYKFKHHLLIHRGLVEPKCFKCSEVGCSYKSDYKKGLIYHIRFVHEITEKKFICREATCEAKFKLQASLDAHVNRIHPPSGSRVEYVCHICGCNLSSKHRVRDHIAVFHERTKDFICTMCSKEFPTRAYLTRHNRRKCRQPKEPGPKTVYCDICQKACSNNNGLKRHMALLHGRDADKTWVCDVCGQRYAIRMYLTRHTKYWKGKNKTCVEGGGKGQPRSATTVVHGDQV